MISQAESYFKFELLRRKIPLVSAFGQIYIVNNWLLLQGLISKKPLRVKICLCNIEETG